VTWPDGTALAASDLPANCMFVVSVQALTPVFHLLSIATGDVVRKAGTQTITGAKTFSAALTMSGAAINAAHGADIASAATLNLTAATGNLVDVTGTTSVTAITLADGAERVVRTTGILTWTHGASLVLPTAANVTSAAGDIWVFRGYAAGVVRMVGYQLASGKALATAYVAPQRAYFYGTVAAGVLTEHKASGLSLTRTGAGSFECTLSPAMPDTYYRIAATASATLSGGAGQGEWVSENTAAGARTTSTFFIHCRGDNIGVQDPDAISIEVFA
jgi:hypothetical protein